MNNNDNSSDDGHLKNNKLNVKLNIIVEFRTFFLSYE